MNPNSPRSDTSGAVSGDGRRAAWGLVYLLALGGLLAAINGYLLISANEDRSWGALGIALYFGPITNVVVGAVSLIGTIVFGVVSRRDVPYATVATGSIVLPAAAIGIDFFFIMSLPLHGC